MSRSPLNTRGSMPGRNIAAPLGAGILVMVGTYALVGTSNDIGVVDEDLVPTVVVVEPISAGTDTAVIADLVEVRMLPRSVRPDGALSDLESLPAGVLVHDTVSGEQLLESSIALDEVDALGGGFTSISVRVDAQRWAGPYGLSLIHI